MTISRCSRLSEPPPSRKVSREPVEQFRVGRGRAHPAEVVGRVDQTPAEVLLPDPVDDRPPGQRVLRDR